MLNALARLLPVKTLLYHKELPFIVPLYHTTGFSHSLPYSRFLYRNRTEKEFERDLDFLLKYFTPVDIETLQIYVAQEKKTVKPYFHITIDDGLASNFEIMAPVLMKKGIPASFFINPAFVGDNDIMHRYKASLLLDAIETNKEYLVLIAQFLGLEENLKSIESKILSMNYKDHEYLNELIKHLGTSWASLLNGNPLYMDMTQLGKLNENGFSIGAHSWDHPEFFLLSIDEQKDQINKSLDWIAQYYPQKIKTFAFPFTDHLISSELFEWLSNKVDLSFGTAGLKKDVYPSHLQRIPVEKLADNMEEIIKTAATHYWIKKLISRSIVRH